MNLKQTLRQNILNIPGWTTKRHIIVIESDDWGSIRMPSLNVYNCLISKGVQFGKYGYEKIDTIATKDDLERLFDLCLSFEDVNGNPLVVTANAVVGNPDFLRIKESGYSEYFWEPITVTMSRYYGVDSPFETWKSGMSERVFYPQLHGREHVNVSLWIKTLSADYPGARLAFENGVYSVIVDKEFDNRIKNTTALRYSSEEEFKVVKQSIIDSTIEFERLFGYGSKSFIAPSFAWNRRIEQILADCGVRFLQGMPMHFYNGKRTLNYIGRSNPFGQVYLNRNVDFELTQNPNRDNIDWAMSQIASAFRWRKPATISMHRLNFIGALDINNRDNNLKQLTSLIKLIQNNWSDVEFLTSDQLGNLIKNSYDSQDCK